MALRSAPRTGRCAARTVARIGAPCVAFAAALASGADARGDEEAKTLDLIYSAPAGCPSSEDFVLDVKRLEPAVQTTPSLAHGRRFVVTVAESGRKGRLTIEDDGARRGAREVEGESCAEVGELLAFAVALALAPDVGPSTSAPAPVIPALAPAPPDAQERAAPERAAPAASSPSPARRIHGDVLAHGSVSSGGAPGAMLGVGASVVASARLGELHPSLRLGFEYAASEPASADGARVAFSRIGALLEPCPTEWRLGALGLRPCARIDVGVRTTTGLDIPAAHSVDRPWIRLGPTAHLRGFVAGPVYADVGGGLAFALTRDRVFFAPDITVHEVPLVSAFGEIAVGVAFR